LAFDIGLRKICFEAENPSRCDLKVVADLPATEEAARIEAGFANDQAAASRKRILEFVPAEPAVPPDVESGPVTRLDRDWSRYWKVGCNTGA
jgi:hypothetical protein